MFKCISWSGAVVFQVSVFFWFLYFASACSLVEWKWPMGLQIWPRNIKSLAHDCLILQISYIWMRPEEHLHTLKELLAEAATARDQTTAPPCSRIPSEGG